MSWNKVNEDLYNHSSLPYFMQRIAGVWNLFTNYLGRRILIPANDLFDPLFGPYPNIPLAANAAPVLYTRLEMVRAATINNGASVGAAFNVQPLNTVAFNGIGIVLAGNAFTTPALPGGYTRITCRASAPAYRAGLHQLTILNVTDGVTRLAGTSEAHDSTTVTQTRSHVVKELSPSTQYRLEHWFQFANAVGLGQAANSGANEVYAIVEFWMEP